MGKKVKVDTEKLQAARKELEWWTNETNVAELIAGRKTASLSDNWNSPSGKEFKNKIDTLYLDLANIDDVCKCLYKECGSAINRAENADFWLWNLIKSIFNIG